MPVREFRRNVPLYIYDENDQSFRSIGVLDKCTLRTDMAEMTDLDTVETELIYDMAEIKIQLKLRFWDRIRLRKLLVCGPKDGFFQRLKSAILCSYEGIKYQISQKLHVSKH